MDINSINLVRDLVLVKLPPETEQLLRDLPSGITFSTLDAVRYHPTHGRIINFSSTLKLPNSFFYSLSCSVLNPDLDFSVYFSKLMWQTAKDAAFDFEDERERGRGTESDTYAFYDGKSYYMAIPFPFLYLALYDTEITMLNGCLLCEPVYKPERTWQIERKTKEEILSLAKDTSIYPVEVEPLNLIADIEEENYIANAAVVKKGNADFADNTIIVTLPHCDILLEEPLNHPLYSKESFIIESENVIGTIMENNINPGNKRLLIRPLEMENDSAVVNMSVDFSKANTAEVVAIGNNCVSGVSVGDTVFYIRNSGIKVPPLKGLDSTLEFIDDGEGNSKVFGFIKKDT